MARVKVHKLKIEPMTEESFAPYGEIMDARAHPNDHREFFPIAFEADGKTTVNIIWQPYDGSFRFTQLERHYGVVQSFVQISGAPAVVCAAAPTSMKDPLAIPEPDMVHAFLIDPTKGFAFKRGTWHSLNRLMLASPGGTFVILNVSPNPTQVVDFQEEYSATYTDLGTDTNPQRVSLKGKYGFTFEVAL